MSRECIHGDDSPESCPPCQVAAPDVREREWRLTPHGNVEWS